MTTYITAQQDGLYFNTTKFSKQDRTIFRYELWTYGGRFREDSMTFYGKINSAGELYIYVEGETTYKNDDESASYCIIRPRNLAGVYSYLCRFNPKEYKGVSFRVFDDSKEVASFDDIPDVETLQSALSGQTWDYAEVPQPFYHWVLWHTGQRTSAGMKNYLAYQGDFKW